MSLNKFIIVTWFSLLSNSAYCHNKLNSMVNSDTIPNTEISTLKETNRNLNELINGLRDQIKSKDDIIENLKKDTLKYSIKAKNIEHENKSTLTKLESKETEFKKFKEETDKSRLKTELEDCIKNNTHIKAENDELKLEKMNSVSEINKLKKSLAEYEQMKKQMDQAERNIKTQLDTINFKNEKIIHLESESKEINEKIKKYEGIENLLIDDFESKVKDLISGHIRRSDDMQIRALEQECEKLQKMMPNNSRIPNLKHQLFSFINECTIIENARSVLAHPILNSDIQNSLNMLSSLKSPNANIMKEKDILIQYLKSYCKIYQEVYKTITELDVLNQKQSRMEDIEFARKKINPKYHTYLADKIDEKARNVMKNGNSMVKVNGCN